MKLIASVKPIEIFISSSMAEDDPTSLELRSMLQAVGKRYELLKYNFIESRASPGNPDYEMQEGIRECHAIAMILHNDEAGTIRKGIFDEYELSIALSKPLFLFVHTAFKPTEHRDAVMRLMRDKKKIWNKKFSDNLGLVDLLEFSLIDFMLVTTRSRLANLGINNDEGISMAEVKAGERKRADDILR